MFNLSPPDALTRRQTVARETWYFFATLVKLIPERRSATTATRSMLSGARPIRRPSSLALRIPAFTRSVISERFKLGNRTDNHDYRSAEWASRINIFAQADELDAEMAQFV